MSLQELLDLEVGNQKKNSSGDSGGNTFSEIARAQVNACWAVFGDIWQDNKEFIYAPTSNDSNGKKARADAYEYLKEIGKSGTHPSQGFVTVVFGNEVLTHPNGKRESGDWHDFTNQWHQNTNLEKLAEKANLGLEELTDKLNGADMPYNAVLKALSRCGEDMPFGKAKWCLVEQIRNEWSFYEGKLDKNNYPYRTRVICKVYKNKAEAVKDAPNYKRDNTSEVTHQLSEKARTNNVTLEILQGYAEKIHADLSSGMDAQVVANKYGVEPDDLHLAKIELAF